MKLDIKTLNILYGIMDKWGENYAILSRNNNDKKNTDQAVAEFLQDLIPESKDQRDLFMAYYNKIKKIKEGGNYGS